MAKQRSGPGGRVNMKPDDVVTELLANRREDLRWYWQLGRQVHQAHPQDRGRFREFDPLELWAEDLAETHEGVSPDLLKKARAIYVAFPIDEDLERLDLTVSHVDAVLAHASLKNDADQRWSVLEDCSKERWPVAELQRRIRVIQGGKRSCGGAPLKPIKSTPEAVEKISRTASMICKLHDLLVKQGKTCGIRVANLPDPIRQPFEQTFAACKKLSDAMEREERQSAAQREKAPSKCGQRRRIRPQSIISAIANPETARSPRNSKAKRT